MPAHSFLIQFHLGEAKRKPAVLQVAVEMWRAIRLVEQQTTFSGCVALQVLCNVGVLINLPFGSGSFQVLHDARRVLLHLLFE